jgi:hypothetical protein
MRAAAAAAARADDGVPAIRHSRRAAIEQRDAAVWRHRGGSYRSEARTKSSARHRRDLGALLLRPRNAGQRQRRVRSTCVVRKRAPPGPQQRRNPATITTGHVYFPDPLHTRIYVCRPLQLLSDLTWPLREEGT